MQVNKTISRKTNKRLTIAWQRKTPKECLSKTEQTQSISPIALPEQIQLIKEPPSEQTSDNLSTLNTDPITAEIDYTHEMVNEPSNKTFSYSPINSNGHKVLYIGLERGNRIVFRWPSDTNALTSLVDPDNQESGHIPGKIESLKDGSNKKLIPLEYNNARLVLGIVKFYDNLRTEGLNKKLYAAIIDDDFSSWYDQEETTRKHCDNAAHLLQYDDSIETKFTFLRKPLFQWQSAGLRFINAITSFGKGAFVCDETGLGKTYTITAHLAHQKLKAVVIAPSGVCESWRRKIQDVSRLSCLAIGSEYPHDAYQHDIIIVSYDMLKKRGIWPLSDIIEGQNRVLVLDESHMAKNYDAKRTRICLKLAEFAKHTIVATATPLKNRVKELHPLLRMTRRLWTAESQDDFTNYYDTEPGRAEIADRLSKFMVRRTFNEVQPTFPKGEVGAAWLSLTNRIDYDDVEHDFIQWLIRQGADIDQLSAAERGRALVKLNKLRELAACGKVKEAINIIDKTLTSGEQCVVFCAFNDPLLQIASALATKTGINYKGQQWGGAGVIIGITPKKKRYQLIDAFNAGHLGLLCIGVAAGGLGIDLPIARFAYFLDLPWSPADFQQCTGRILRIGQERNCQFIKLLASNTIDQRMEALIQDKALIFQEAIGDDDIIDRVTAKDPHLMQSSIVSQLLRTYLQAA